MQIQGQHDLVKKISHEMHLLGKITFSRFMELALYDQDCGYYMTSCAKSEPAQGSRERIGWEGDYYTAPDVHPILAKALVRQIRQIDGLLDQPPELTVLEMGAGKGLLARDVLQECAATAEDLFHRLIYVIIERSPAMQAVQEDHLAPFLKEGGSVKWVPSLNDLPAHSLNGVMLSNELVDAFPVHRVRMEQGHLKELFVEYDGERFYERAADPSSPELGEFFARMDVQLPDGYTTEINLQALQWMQDVARVMEKGIVMTIDYGHTAQDYYAPTRKNGTLLCYYRHTLSDNPYRRIGEQDMTSHVNFTSLALAGERDGLQVTGFTNLMNFLIGLGAPEMLETLDPESRELQSAIHVLHPNGMGRTFKVLIQHKGIPHPTLDALQFQPFVESALHATVMKG